PPTSTPFPYTTLFRSEDSLSHWREAGDRWGVAWSLNDLGNVAFGKGELDAARTLYEESLAIKRELGDKAGIAWSLQSMALVAGRSEEHTSELQSLAYL